MKNRRLAIVTFMLIAILLLGVGYAAVSRQLQITGSAHISAVTASEFDVTFTEPLSSTPTDISGTNAPTATTNKIEAGGHEVTLSVADFETVGDKLVLTYTVTYSTIKTGIHAHLEEPVVIVTNTTNSEDTTEYFNATTELGTDSLTEEATSTVLTLTIELVAVPVEATFVGITVKIVANPVSGENHA